MDSPAELLLAVDQGRAPVWIEHTRHLLQQRGTFPCLLVRLDSALRVSYSMMTSEDNALFSSPFEAQAGMYNFADNGPGAVEIRLSLAH